jgi:hypothetical protein
MPSVAPVFGGCWFDVWGGQRGPLLCSSAIVENQRKQPETGPIQSGRAGREADTITPSEADKVWASTAGRWQTSSAFGQQRRQATLAREEERRGPCAFLESVTIQTGRPAAERRKLRSAGTMKIADGDL